MHAYLYPVEHELEHHLSILCVHGQQSSGLLFRYAGPSGSSFVTNTINTSSMSILILVYFCSSFHFGVLFTSICHIAFSIVHTCFVDNGLYRESIEDTCHYTEYFQVL